MSIDESIQQYAEGFFDEAADLLSNAEQLLLQLDPANPQQEDVNAIFRVAHSIKGGAGTFGFTALMETTHLMESHLDRARNGQRALTPHIVDVLLETKDALQDQVRAYRANKEPDAQAVDAICERLRGLDVGAAAAAWRDPDEVMREVGLTADQIAALKAHGIVPAGDTAPPPKPLRELAVTLQRVSDADRESILSELAIMGTVLSTRVDGDSVQVVMSTTCTADDVSGICAFVLNDDQISVTVTREPDVPPPAAPASAAPAAHAGNAGDAASPPKAQHEVKDAGKEGASIRVDVTKVDKIMNQVGELVITQAMLTEAASRLDPVVHERIHASIGHFARNALNLQESVMQIRMLPMENVFSRYPRVIRDTSAKLGKQVRLQTYGKETELDKGLIERIVDPLTHLVRNSLDHGIESPADRVAAGKDPTGTLLLSAQHRGGNIVIEVSDDGAGLSRERILSKAAKQGLPISDSISDEEVWQLIFLPGFSTAEQVTGISGRGVGMDVVRRNIRDMGGHVEISSRAGQGTTTRIILPLTLAILNGMSVRVGTEIYIVPLNYVCEALQPSADNLHRITGDREVIRVRGEYLPLVALHRVFVVPDAKTDPLAGILVIVQVGDTQLALLVDELVGQHQVVVKNLETNYRRVPGISAATILGDGSVAFIVDVAAMQRLQGAGAAGGQAVSSPRRELATAP